LQKRLQAVENKRRRSQKEKTEAASAWEQRS
jgi:hypothetical protein